MNKDFGAAGNVILLRVACLWLLAALVLAWCLVGLDFGVPFVKHIFPGKFTRVLQAHLDFLLMTVLILGFYATKTPLPWHVRWAMVVGAFTNSSVFFWKACFQSGQSGTARRLLPHDLSLGSHNKSDRHQLWVWQGGGLRVALNI